MSFIVNSSILFFFFSLILTCAFLIILVSNPIHSVLFLVLLFCNCAALLIIYGIEFLSIMLIIIYVGAIAILFLFVVMMLDIKVLSKINKDFYNYFFFCSFLLIIFFLETYLSTIKLLNNNNILQFFINYNVWINYIDNITNIETIGQVLYTYNLALFLIAGIILLIALIGAVFLTKKKNKNVVNNTFKQISRLKNNAIFYIK